VAERDRDLSEESDGDADSRCALNVHNIALDPRAKLIVPLSLPIAGDRRDFRRNLIDRFFETTPWATMQVEVYVSVREDASVFAQCDTRQPQNSPILILPRVARFSDAHAGVTADVIEPALQRRSCLWSKGNATVSRRSFAGGVLSPCGCVSALTTASAASAAFLILKNFSPAGILRPELWISPIKIVRPTLCLDDSVWICAIEHEE